MNLRHLTLSLTLVVLLAPAWAAPTFGQTADTAPATQQLPPFIPPLTDEDRRAAFPDVEAHAMHGTRLNYLLLFDQFEWQGGDGNRGDVDTRGWVGGDRSRIWFRAEGGGDGRQFDGLQSHVLYGRRVSRWWDVVAGVRQDSAPGNQQTSAAIGLQGLAPYWFEVQATAYVASSGVAHARLEIEYDLLLTNRLILQPLFEAEVFARSDPDRRIGAGLSTTDLGLRVRYEWRRQFAPYAGVTWDRRWGQTARFADTDGERRAGTRIVTGLRIWL
jgi:copper resistance protein B